MRRAAPTPDRGYDSDADGLQRRRQHPHLDPYAYIDEIIAAMTADGWSDGAPPGKVPYGRAMHMGQVMALVSPNPDHPDRGIVEIYGECRNAADHSGDDEDIRAELTS